MPRPLEWGPTGPSPDPPDPDVDAVAADFHALAEHLESVDRWP